MTSLATASAWIRPLCQPSLRSVDGSSRPNNDDRSASISWTRPRRPRLDDPGLNPPRHPGLRISALSNEMHRRGREFANSVATTERTSDRDSYHRKRRRGSA
jgi:hypothetical protein